MLPRIALVSMVATIALGCGATNSFDGTVAGNTLRVEASIFLPLQDSTGTTLGAALVMTDVADLCAAFIANRLPKNMTAAAFLVFRTQDSGSTRVRLAPDQGTYTVVLERNAADIATLPVNYAFASFFKGDANCSNLVDFTHAEAQSGIIDVDQIDLGAGGTMTGNFDVRFGSQNDQVKGTFNASLCDTKVYVSRTCG